jgi:hypothetical protein
MQARVTQAEGSVELGIKSSCAVEAQQTFSSQHISEIDGASESQLESPKQRGVPSKS